jgi:hypothetical protein
MEMASATVRISLKAQEVGLYRRQLFLEKANVAFATLRMQPEAWAVEEEERAAWDVTLSDGLDD